MRQSFRIADFFGKLGIASGLPITHSRSTQDGLEGAQIRSGGFKCGGELPLMSVFGGLHRNRFEEISAINPSPSIFNIANLTH